jgi:hypothetical protein
VLQRPVILVLPLVLSVPGCGGGSRQSKQIEPVYDKQTGRLRLLKYDSRNEGRPDTFSYMDGARVLKIEIDQDGDGKIDRWEYYDADQKLEKVGFSRGRDGKEDAWSYAAPDGSIARIDISTRRDGKVTRVEYYEHDQLVRAEEDTDEDGRTDKWETYDSGRLSSVSFDLVHRGSAGRRLIYGANGSARVEVDPDGSGQWRPAPSK